MTPGIKHLGKVVKDRLGRISLTEVTRSIQIFGVDMSTWLMKALRNVAASDQFNENPPVPVTAITILLDKYKNTLDGANLIHCGL